MKKQINFKESFFVFLFAIVIETENPVYVCEDGNIFCSKADAEIRRKDILARKGRFFAYAEITKDNLPTDNKELSKLLSEFQPEDEVKPEKREVKKTDASKDVQKMFEEFKKARKKKSAADAEK